MRISASRASYGSAALLLVTLLLHTLLIAAQPVAASAGQTHIYLPIAMTGTTTHAAVSVAQQVVDLTNQERSRNGCPALTISSKLSDAADAHSRDMALNDLFRHTGSDGSSMVDRANRVQYSWTRLAENIAAGQTTAEDVVAAWMASPGHRANILNCDLHEIGVGFYDQPDDQANVRDDSGGIGGPYHYYWTQDFGTS